MHDRREHLLRDVPVAGRATVLVWWKRIWRCPNPACVVRTWTEQSPLARLRQSLTARVKAWVTRRVGADGETVSSVARSLDVGWWSVMRAVVEVGRPMVDDPGRLADVSGLGVDEHAWQRANAVRTTQYATVSWACGRTGRPGCWRSCPVAPAGSTGTGWRSSRTAGASRSRWRRWIRSGAI
ncbi:MAG: transposase family protein [Micromonosporaceae bacterium]|nr:transposase family protein [Micromonosporaceae bacterium]